MIRMFCARARIARYSTCGRRLRRMRLILLQCWKGLIRKRGERVDDGCLLSGSGVARVKGGLGKEKKKTPVYSGDVWSKRVLRGK